MKSLAVPGGFGFLGLDFLLFVSFDLVGSLLSVVSSSVAWSRIMTKLCSFELGVTGLPSLI